MRAGDGGEGVWVVVLCLSLEVRSIPLERPRSRHVEAATERDRAAAARRDRRSISRRASVGRERGWKNSQIRIFTKFTKACLLLHFPLFEGRSSQKTAA